MEGCSMLTETVLKIMQALAKNLQNETYSGEHTPTPPGWFCALPHLETSFYIVPQSELNCSSRIYRVVSALALDTDSQNIECKKYTAWWCMYTRPCMNTLSWMEAWHSYVLCQIGTNSVMSVSMVSILHTINLDIIYSKVLSSYIQHSIIVCKIHPSSFKLVRYYS